MSKRLEELGISPAPWTFDHGPMVSVVYEAKPLQDCASVCAMCGEFRKNDARLIAAAPKLYEALREAVDEFKMSHCKQCPWFDNTDRDYKRHKCRCQNDSSCMALEWNSALVEAGGESEARVWCKNDPTRKCVDCEICADGNDAVEGASCSKWVDRSGTVER